MTTWEAWVIETQNKIRALESDLYDYRERAIKSEAEVERLKKHLRWATGVEGDFDDELTKLRKVVGAVRRVMDAVMAQPQDVKERNIALVWLDVALVELDEEDAGC